MYLQLWSSFRSICLQMHCKTTLITGSVEGAGAASPICKMGLSFHIPLALSMPISKLDQNICTVYYDKKMVNFGSLHRTTKKLHISTDVSTFYYSYWNQKFFNFLLQISSNYKNSCLFQHLSQSQPAPYTPF